jgi:hypothetical protein
MPKCYDNIVDACEIDSAIQMKEIYGLYHLTPIEIISVWRFYSDKVHCSPWTSHNKHNVEEAFGLDLSNESELEHS